MKDIFLKKDIKNYLRQLPPHVAERDAAKLLNRCSEQIETLEGCAREMATMLDLFHTCIATEKMPVLNSECDETILILLRKAGKIPTCNITGSEQAA